MIWDSETRMPNPKIGLRLRNPVFSFKALPSPEPRLQIPEPQFPRAQCAKLATSSTGVRRSSTKLAECPSQRSQRQGIWPTPSPRDGARMQVKVLHFAQFTREWRLQICKLTRIFAKNKSLADSFADLLRAQKHAR